MAWTEADLLARGYCVTCGHRPCGCAPVARPGPRRERKAPVPVADCAALLNAVLGAHRWTTDHQWRRVTKGYQCQGCPVCGDEGPGIVVSDALLRVYGWRAPQRQRGGAV